MDLGMLGFDVFVRTGVAIGEDVFLDGVEAVEAPVVLSDAAERSDVRESCGGSGRLRWR
jgi:hypothetical protein